jgi:outer membrane protein OmpA-like peptidoglycan-associated protein/Tol biopolymer transport system component
MKQLMSCVLFVATACACIAQPYGDSKFKQKFNKADALTYDGSYLEALPLLEDLYAYDTSNANLNYLLGVCYLMGKKNHSLAIKRLESATKDVSLEHVEANWKERKAPGVAYYYLGRAYHYKNRFDRAITNYYNYRSFIEMDDVETYNQVRHQIQYAENAIELIKTPVSVKATNLGSSINTKYPDYCPIVSADGQTLIFTSRRAGGTSDNQDEDGNYYDDIYVCQKQPDGKWSTPKGIGSNINSTGHDAAIGLSPDGQLLFIYKDDNGDGNIYQSRKQIEGWTKSVPLGSDVNTRSWETHATVNATQDMLIFVSNRNQGGFGGRDLWYCKKLPNDEWGLAMNMGSAINTQYEEDSPFISADGNTLIFSSQGHTSMGGFDIFKSEWEDGVWSAPENIGYPINTAEDDVFFTLTPDGSHAYYSSRMDGGYGDADVYKLRLEPNKIDAVAVARGLMKVPAQDYANIKARIVVSDEGGTQLGTYRPNRETGYYVLILQPDETYTISYEADGYDPIATQVQIAREEIYIEYDGVVELGEVVFGENILALQADTERLRKERQEAEARAVEDERLAAITAENAKSDAEQLALKKQSDAERILAEQKAAKERENAAKALAAEQEKAKKAELERKEEAVIANNEVEQLLATQQAEEASDREIAAKEQADREGAAQEKAARELAAKQIAEEEAREQAAEMEAARLAAEAEEQAKTAEKLAAKAEEEAASIKNQEELIARIAEAAKKEKAQEELLVKQKAEEEAQAQADLEAASKAVNEAEAERLADAEVKRQALQNRIQALKQQKDEPNATPIKQVKEVAVQKMVTPNQSGNVDAEMIRVKREAMLAKISELKNRKSEVEKKKVVDEAAVVQASAKEKEAIKKKQDLETRSGKKKEAIAALQKELEQVEGQVVKVEEEIEIAKTEVAEAEEKVSQDIAETKRIAEEAKKQEEEAAEAKRQIEELEELERQRIEQERLATEQFEREQNEEAERARMELIQVEALADQQRQVEAALQAEEKKKLAIAAAEQDAFSEQEILANAETLEQLRDLNLKLIKDNLELKKQLADLNRKLDMILARLDYAPEPKKVELPANSTMRNLQGGKRMILRNIFFDYNQASLRSRSRHELNKLYDFMKQNPTASIQVSGHTDSRGNDDYNMRLSKDRAQSVVDYLIRNGISSSRLQAVGYGETRPIARNENADSSDNPVGRQLNRRIEISIPKGAVKGVQVEAIKVPTGAQIK